MNKLSTNQRAQILHMLVEGNSLRAAARMADVSRNTVCKLLRDAGEACLGYQDRVLRNLSCQRVQCDEIWSFVYAKQKNVPEEKKDQAGDIWTWVAIDSDTKLVPCWHVGNRTLEHAELFIEDLASRLANRVQLSTDGHQPYLSAIDDSFGNNIDYGRLIKIYGPYTDKETNRRYSRSEFVRAERQVKKGDPNPKHISTSYVERQNLTMRMSMRRFTRLTNGFSKKIENHMHAISLHYMYYNFCRIHKSLRVTPAMEAGIADSVYDLEFIVGLIDAMAPPSKKRGPYKKISN
jgi:IS1 family transposase